MLSLRQFGFENLMNPSAPSSLHKSKFVRIPIEISLQIQNLLAIPLVRRALACFGVFAVSALLILPNLGFPRGIVFDEAYYITHAQKYLNGVFFEQTHPPLGKLLIAAGERWLHPHAPADEFVDVEAVTQPWPTDLDITGYRLMPAVLGMLNPVIVFFILAMILGNEWFALVISMFVAFDNALILESRTALLDSTLIFFILASVLAFVYLMRMPHRRLAAFVGLSAVFGAMAACAADVKLSGFVVFTLAGFLGLRLLWSRQIRRFIVFILVFGGVFAVTYLGIWQIHFAIAQKFDPSHNYGISVAQQRILEGIDHPDPVTRFIVQFKDATNYEITTGITKIGRLDLGNMGIGSPWYWWLVGGRTINFRHAKDNGQDYSYSTLIGNPVTWLISLLGVVLGTGLVLTDLLFRFLPRGQRLWVYVFVLLYWAYMIPFIVTQRITYLHHYLPALLIGIILFGIMLWQTRTVAWIHKRDFLVIATILLVFAFWAYSPFTYAEPLTIYQFQQRNIWPAWDLKCFGC